MLSSIDRQDTNNYWARENIIPAEEKTSISQAPQQNIKTSPFEGENKAHEAVPKIPNLPMGKVNVNATPPLTNKKSDLQVPPNVPNIPNEVWSQSSTEPNAINESKDLDPLKSTDNPPRPPSSVDSDYNSLYENSNEPLQQPIKVNDRQLVRQGEHTKTVSTNGTDIVCQGEQNSMARIEDDQEKCDFIMTGWDPIAPVAGSKRNRSPEPEIITNKRGRPVKKVNYHKLHHGKMEKNDSDPKTWAEAIEGPDSKEWQKAAKEEICSLNETGAIEIVDHKKLPTGRTLMKSKWVFKKKYLADGKLDKYRARCTVKGFT